ncbi:MAG TPA: DUF4272 domain-containing protein [Verrucomicrobiae bacterium]|nr:DUF4272 domain-containing protein [Verrucomicrobiae bacterium]
MANPRADEVARRLVILKYQVIQAMTVPPVLRMSYKNWQDSEQKKFHSQLQEKLDELRNGFRKLELWEFLSDSEEKFFSTNPLDLDDRQIVNASWRTESVMVLMWVLGLISELPSFDVQASLDLLKQIPNENLSSFFSNAKLIEQEIIEQKRTEAELWHWRSRTRQLIQRKEPFPQNIPQFKSYDEIVRFSAKAASEKDGLKIIDEDFAVKGKAYRDLTDAEWSEVTSIAIERHFALNWLCGRAPGNNWDETPTDT